ncbi:MAG: metallophosphoesterase [Aquabacterium sp.]
MLPAEPTLLKPGTVRFAAVGDLHCSRTSAGTLRPLFAKVAEVADALLLCGDLTDYGLPEEAKILTDELAALHGKPVVAVLGNHDVESDQVEEVVRILTQSGVRVLDGEACEVHGIGIAGTKGFAGGFGRGALGPWGERMIKQFVNEAIQEALKLESALAKLRTAHRIAMLHYAPVVETVVGEPSEIFPFLGTSRLEDPLMRQPVSVVFHGHAHRGSAQGHTANGIPVFNVARPLLERLQPDQPAFKVFDLPAAEDQRQAGGEPAAPHMR